MKFTLVINQPQIIKLGVKNINQAHIFDLLTTCPAWASTEVVDGVVYYWVARQKIVQELPLLGIKSDTAYRHLKALSKLKLIEYIKLGKKDLIRLTKKGKKYHSESETHYVGNKSEKQQNTMSEINPKKLGNKSEYHSEIFPTYKTTNTNTTTIDNLDTEAWQLWKQFKKEKGQTYKKTGERMAMEKLAGIPYQNQMICIKHSISNNYSGFFPEKFMKEANLTPPSKTKYETKGELSWAN